MAIVKMQKLSVIGMNDEKPALLKDLMDLGAVEINGPEDKLQDEAWRQLVVKDGDESAATACDHQIAQAETALSALDRYAGSQKSLFATRRLVTESAYGDMLAQEESYEQQMLEIVELSDKLNDSYAQENSAKALIASLEPWRSYALPLELTETDCLSLRLGVAPPMTDVNALGEALADAGYACELEEIGRDKEQCYLSLWYFREDEDKVLEIVKAQGYTAAALGELEGSVADNIDRATKSVENLTTERETLIQQIKDRAEYRSAVECYHDIVLIRRDRARVRSKLLTTEETFTFDGWMPAAAADRVERVLDKYTCWHELTEPEEDDDVPVRLQHGKFCTPIEFITEMYSLPSWKEVDPTAIFSMFYIVFFGIMFGDIGYGLLLILLTGFALKKYKLYEGGAYKLIKVVFYSGISSLIWGFLFGSCFGDLFPVIADTFFDKTLVIKPLWLDPAKSPMVFLIFACGFGVVHLFVGMGINAYQLIKNGQVLTAIKDVFAWYLIVLGIILWLFGTRVSEGAPGVGKIMTIIGVALAMILPFFVNKGVGKVLGIWDLYSGITGNLSDILSYSRLLGLGLASTSIAQVFNFLASMGGKSVVGVIMFIVIGLLGHTLNFAINALGAFVHSCRLQFVEFFGKFYEGGGRAFAPFNRNTKFINIIEEDR